jgi:hypothetical protein
MNGKYYKNLQRETGMSTLVVILLLLFVATLVSMYTASSTIREQQVSANQYRSGQALSAANAGLDFALGYYTKNAGADGYSVDSDGDGCEDSGPPDGVIDTLCVPASMLTAQAQFINGATDHVVSAQVSFTDGDPSTDRDGDGIFTNDALDRPHTLTSQGFSDDQTATRTIQVQVDLFGSSPGGGLPGFPLIAKGVAPNGGNFAIINRFGHATIWTGADSTTIGSAETYVMDPFDPPTTRAEYVDISGAPDPTQVLHASYFQAGLNSDVIEGDDNLTNLTDDEFFRSFMNEEKATMRAMAESIGQRYDADNISWNDLTVANGVRGLVWIDGDWSESGTLETIGSEQFPITLIINGEFTTTGTGGAEIAAIGLIYVVDNWDSGGNFGVQGGVIVEGDVDNTGTPTIVYDNNLYDGSLGVPPGAVAAILAGTWRDW